MKKKKEVKKRKKKATRVSMKVVKNPYFILIGTENDRKRYRYDILKQNIFTQAFIQFMLELGFGDDDLIKIYPDPYHNVPLRATDIKDDCIYFKNKNYEMDLFYGAKQIVLVVRPKSDKSRRELIRAIEKYSIWKKFPKKTQQI